MDIQQDIKELKTGEALVSVLNKDGSPTPVERVLICLPELHNGSLTEAERKECLVRSPYKDRYEQVIDRESAYEMLKQKAEHIAAISEQQKKSGGNRKSSGSRRGGRQSVGEAMLKSAVRSIGSQIGRQIIRGIMGSLLGGRR